MNRKAVSDHSVSLVATDSMWISSEVNWSQCEFRLLKKKCSRSAEQEHLLIILLWFLRLSSCKKVQQGCPSNPALHHVSPHSLAVRRSLYVHSGTMKSRNSLRDLSRNKLLNLYRKPRGMALLCDGIVQTRRCIQVPHSCSLVKKFNIQSSMTSFILSTILLYLNYQIFQNYNLIFLQDYAFHLQKNSIFYLNQYSSQNCSY